MRGMTRTYNRRNGFMLLELLLVVGIAAILIISGVTTYNLVNRSNRINNAVKLVSHLIVKTQSIYSGTNDYGNENIEAMLYNTNNVPPQYRSSTAGEITTPFSSSASAIAIMGSGMWSPPNDFDIQMIVPPAYIVEFLQAFGTGIANEINVIHACGMSFGNYGANGMTFDVPMLSAACGDSTVSPNAANVTLIVQ